MTGLRFIAVERFGPDHGEAWANYIAWSKLTQLEEVVSFDALLCPTVLHEIRDDYWPHLVSEAPGLPCFFTDLIFLRQQLAKSSATGARLLCVVRNPTGLPALPPDLSSFSFFGFDLVEADSGISALSNCGGWPELENSELSKCGLLTDHERALELQSVLRRNHPEEPHADCDIWAIFAERE